MNYAVNELKNKEWKTYSETKVEEKTEKNVHTCRKEVEID